MLSEFPRRSSPTITSWVAYDSVSLTLAADGRMCPEVMLMTQAS